MIYGYIELTRIKSQGSILVNIEHINVIMKGNEGTIICLDYDDYIVAETYDKVKAMIAEKCLSVAYHELKEDGQ